MEAEILTPKGSLRVVEVTSFLPGRKIPEDWVRESSGGNLPFFFIPSNWNDDNCWGGKWLNHRLSPEKRFPMCYSTGFATAEKALSAATKWEAIHQEREERRAKAFNDCFGL